MPRLAHDIDQVEQDIGFGNLAVADDAVEPEFHRHQPVRWRNTE